MAGYVADAAPRLCRPGDAVLVHAQTAARRHRHHVAVGMLADVSDASLFGQHALAYTLLAFGGVALHRRLRMFDLRQQTTQVLGIFALTYATYALVHWQVNGYVVWPYFLAA